MRFALPLFRVAGISVYLHYTWFIVAAVEITRFANRYGSPIWSALEYLSLFGIVLLHEFGHALACRQTGGKADRIVLWPLGGIAFVEPPPRATAYLWSIAAGPLVNAILFPFFTTAALLSVHWHWQVTHRDLSHFLFTLLFMNGFLFFFNLLPIYPLDGGQIVRALLWLRIGPIRSLKVSGMIGVAGAFIFAAWAFTTKSIWMGILALFLFGQSNSGWKAAEKMELAAKDAASGAPRSPVAELPNK